jgi:hypothetical protein
MAEKRLTAEEMRQQQVARKLRESERLKKAEEAVKDTQNRHYQSALVRAASDIKSTWYEQVDAASKNDQEDFRFVVLALYVRDEFSKPVVQDLLATIRAEGYSAELVGSLRPVGPTRIGIGLTPNVSRPPTHNVAGPVTDGKSVGWYPGPLPTIGRAGNHEYMVVRW